MSSLSKHLEQHPFYDTVVMLLFPSHKACQYLPLDTSLGNCSYMRRNAGEHCGGEHRGGEHCGGEHCGGEHCGGEMLENIVVAAKLGHVASGGVIRSSYGESTARHPHSRRAETELD